MPNAPNKETEKERYRAANAPNKEAERAPNASFRSRPPSHPRDRMRPVRPEAAPGAPSGWASAGDEAPGVTFRRI